MDQTVPSEVSKLYCLSDDGALPLVVEGLEGQAWEDGLAAVHDLVRDRLHQVGGILFRRFGILGEQPFRRFAASFGHPLLSYDFGSTPRSAVGEGVYTSTEYPAHQVIPLHNEQSYTRCWPMKIWFHCIAPGDAGGHTPIADSRLIHARLDPGIRDRVAQRRLASVRNYGNGLDLPWQRAFNTRDRAVVERFCKAQGIAWEWKPDGELRTRQVCQAVARHPHTGQMVWFNQAHLFHVSNMAPALRETLLSVVGGEQDLPRNVYYGDGSAIEPSALEHIRGVLDDCAVSFAWRRGDVLMLDNMLVAHGRATFKGDRRVVVAMAQTASEQAHQTTSEASDAAGVHATAH